MTYDLLWARLQKDASPKARKNIETAKMISELADLLDMVAVVRCKDCKYSDEYCHCSRVDWWTNENDFCSRGVTKEED